MIGPAARGKDLAPAILGVAEDELRRVFNLGIGMCAVVPEAPAGALVIGELA